MRFNGKRAQKKKAEVRDNELFVPIKVYFPLSLYNILARKSDELDLPASRLVSIAVDNELDSPVPFSYACEIPQNPPYVQFAYADEGHKILRYLKNFRIGAGLDMLMLCRRDIGVLDKAMFLLGMRDLLKSDMVYESAPPRKAKFHYNENYRYIRPTEVDTASKPEQLLEEQDDTE